MRKFRGFESIIKESYMQESRDCKGCENDCRYKIVTLEDGKKFFSEDLCEKYSGVQKKKLGNELPDLFEEYDKLLETFSVFNNNGNGKREIIGIPRGLMFNELYPFFNAFFFELGFNVKVSEKTNKRIIQQGLENVVGEPCYPIKVSHGHIVDLIGKSDYIFTPLIINLQDEIYPQSYTCPYVQAAPDMFRAALKEKNAKFLSPVLYFRRERKQIENEFKNMFKENKLDVKEREIKKALEFAFSVHEGFHRAIKKRGEQILNDLKEDEIAFAIIGRSYAIYDPAMNMNIGKKIRDLGFLAIPLDFLPVENFPVDSEFSNLYSRQAQKILSAAKIIKEDKRLRAIIIDYFACGPNAFINQFFKGEINTKIK